MKNYLPSVRIQICGFVLRNRLRNGHLQTPHLPPSLAQCRQYLQFLQALQGSLPVHVEAENTSSGIRVRRVSDRNKREANDKILFVVIRRPSFRCGNICKLKVNRLGSAPRKKDY
jgi:hypothetical protein